MMSNPSLLDGLESQTHKANCACLGIAKGSCTQAACFCKALTTLDRGRPTATGTGVTR